MVSPNPHPLVAPSNTELELTCVTKKYTYMVKVTGSFQREIRQGTETSIFTLCVTHSGIIQLPCYEDTRVALYRVSCGETWGLTTSASTSYPSTWQIYLGSLSSSLSQAVRWLQPQLIPDCNTIKARTSHLSQSQIPDTHKLWTTVIFFFLSH